MKNAVRYMILVSAAAGFLAGTPALGNTQTYFNPGDRFVVDHNVVVALPYTPVVGPGFIYYPPVQSPGAVIFTGPAGGYVRNDPATSSSSIVIDGTSYLVKRNGGSVETIRQGW